MPRRVIILVWLSLCLGHIASVEASPVTDWDISLLTDSGLIRLTRRPQTGDFSINKTQLETAIHQYQHVKNPLYAKPVNLTKLVYDCQTHSFFILDESSSTVFVWNEIDGTITCLLQEQGLHTIEYDPLTKTFYWIHATSSDYYYLFSAPVNTSSGQPSLSLAQKKRIRRLPVYSVSVKLLYQRYTRDLIVAVNTQTTFLILRFDTANRKVIRRATQRPSTTNNDYQGLPIFVHRIMIGEHCATGEKAKPADKPYFSFGRCQLVDMDWNDELLFLLIHCQNKTNSAILLTNLTNVAPTTYNTCIFYNDTVDHIEKISFGRNYYLSYPGNGYFPEKILRLVTFNNEADSGEPGRTALMERSSIKQLNLAALGENLTSVLMRHKFPHDYCLFTNTITEKGKHAVLSPGMLYNSMVCAEPLALSTMMMSDQQEKYLNHSTVTPAHSSTGASTEEVTSESTVGFFSLLCMGNCYATGQTALSLCSRCRQQEPQQTTIRPLSRKRHTPQKSLSAYWFSLFSPPSSVVLSSMILIKILTS